MLSQLKKNLSSNPIKGDFNSLADEENNSNDNAKISIDKIINDYGYGWEIWKIIISVFLCFILNGFLTTSFCSFILAYQKLFSLSSGQISILGTLFFITKFISSFTVGYLSHLFNRIYILRASLCIAFASCLFNSFFLSFSILLLIQFFNGICAGVFEITSFNIACEFTPIRFRGWVMLSIWNGYNVGVLFPNLIMYFTMPQHQPEGLNLTLGACSLVILICAVFCFIFLKDSPRNDIVNGKIEDGIKTLEKLTKNKAFTEEEKGEILKSTLQYKRPDNDDIRDIDINKTIGGISAIFSNGMKRTGIILVFICFFGNIINDGFQLVLNLLLEKIEKISINNEYNVLKNNILINTIGLPSNLVLGLFTEFKVLGRRHTQALGFFLLAIVIFPILLVPQKAYICLIFFMFFTCITNMVNVYVSEIYPTKTRDLALGFIQAIGYFGSCVSQFVFVYLTDWNFYICPIIFMILCVCNGILSMSLKIDTYGRPLDSSITPTPLFSIEKKEKLNSIVELGIQEEKGKN